MLMPGFLLLGCTQSSPSFYDVYQVGIRFSENSTMLPSDVPDLTVRAGYLCKSSRVGFEVFLQIYG